MAMVWLITGASSGLGDGIARAVLDRGDFAAVTSRDTDRLKPLTEKYPNQAFPVTLDLNNAASMRQAVQSVLERFGKVNVLVNNAGYGYRAAIEESEPAAVEELFPTNFFGPMELVRLILPQMRAQHSGFIINISSIGAVRGALGNGYYSAAKGALELASEALSKEVQQLGIRVMVAEPGALRTGFYGEQLKSSSIHISDYDALAGKYRKTEQTDSNDQPGDPLRAGKLLVQTALQQDAPFRLLLGSDALHAAVETLETRLREARIWAEVSGHVDFDENQSLK